MDVLRSLPDNAFDLGVVDCPYGDAQQSDNQTVTEGGGGTTTDSEVRTADSRGTSGKSKWNRFSGGNNISRYARLTELPRPIQPIQLPPPSEHADGQRVIRTGGTWATKYAKKIIGWDVAPTEEYFKELFRVTKNQIIWGANYFPNMPPTRCFIVWRKLTISEKFTMAMAEYAWTSFNQNAKVFEFAPQGKKGDPRFHPTQKPIELYTWILNNFAKKGDTILDTHLGSGSSAIACHQLGFTMTGIEIDDYYYQMAKERLLRYQQQNTLF
jgi:site-specific DNA-methyltransferase (adenine-specific)